MNKSAIFKKAHATARLTVAIVGDYMIAFSLALKTIYGELKMSKQEKPLTAEALNQLPFVCSANQWKDRVYINLVGNGGSYRGERNAKIWIKDGELNVQLANGTTSGEWDCSLSKLKKLFA